MHKILVTGPKFDGSMVFEMDDAGIVRMFENQATLTDSQLEWLSKNFPITLNQLNAMISAKMINAKLIETDLSFTSFWEKYNYKVSKVEAERNWNKLSKPDKLLAFNNIDPYNRYLSLHPNMEKMYPATYLNPKKRNFENDYKALCR